MRLSVLIAILITCIAFTWLLHQPAVVIANNQGKAECAQKGPENKHCETFWERTTYEPVAFYTLIQALFAGVLGVIAFLQIRMFKRQLEIAQKQIDIALATLNKPWLIVERVTVHRLKDGLRASFKIANYGNSPAVIFSAKAVFFLSLSDRMKEDFSSDVLQRTKDFPKPENLPTFLNREAREISEEIKIPATPNEFGTPIYQKVIFDGGIAIPKESDSPVYFSALIPIKPNFSGLPIELALPAYLIGQFFYQSPHEQGHINFCFECPRHGQPRAVYGAPYNETKKSHGENEGVK